MSYKDTSHQIEGVMFVSNNQPTFWNWCNKRGLTVKDIEKFQVKDKMKVVLRWKWFTDDDTSAKECEETRREILESMRQMPPQDEAAKHWLKNALYLESEANKIKAYFGLISQAEYEALEKADQCK